MWEDLLPLCNYCLEHKITPPTVNALTNIFDKHKEEQVKEKRKLDTAVKVQKKKQENKRNSLLSFVKSNKDYI